MHVSVNPLYRCNFRCAYCYLTPEQLQSREVLDLNLLDQRLAELPSVSAVELYGGEISLLPEDYIHKLRSVVRRHYRGPISVITNLFQVPGWFLDEDIELSVSYDFQYRPHHEQVLTNLLSLPRHVNLIILATPEVVKGDVFSQIGLIRSLSNIRTVEIKPYSTNQANRASGMHRAFVEYVKVWLDHFPRERLKNVALLEEVRKRTRNAYSDEHVYITPQGQFAVLEFDAQDREYFKTLNSYEEYLAWCQEEKERVLAMACRTCPYQGRCLTEHYRREEGVHDECSGFRSLLDWWMARTA